MFVDKPSILDAISLTVKSQIHLRVQTEMLIEGGSFLSAACFYHAFTTIRKQKAAREGRLEKRRIGKESSGEALQDEVEAKAKAFKLVRSPDLEEIDIHLEV